MMMTPVYNSGVCTLPRQHWPAPSNRHSMSMTMTQSPPILYSDMSVLRTCPSGTILTNDYGPSTRIPLQRCLQTSLDSNTSITTMTTTSTVPSTTTMTTITKRESSV